MMQKKEKTGAAYPPPPEEYADCNGYVDPPGDCKILTEMLCVTRGTCKLYKAKGKGKKNEP